MIDLNITDAQLKNSDLPILYRENLLQKLADEYTFGNITESNYDHAKEIAEDFINENYDHATIKNLNHRKENRSYLDFSKDIRISSLKEKETFDAFLFYLSSMCENIRGNITYIETGVNNNGKLIIKNVHGKADYKIECLGKSFNVEIKNCPIIDRFTIKGTDLRRYAGIGNTYVVVGCQKSETLKRMYIIRPPGVEYLAGLPFKVFYSEHTVKPLMGGKEGVQISVKEPLLCSQSERSVSFMIKNRFMRKWNIEWQN